VKIVLFGMNGQVGWELQRALAPLGDVVCVGRSGESMRADFSNPDTVLQILQQTSPTVIVNAAAYTAVDMAEEDSENAMKTNAHTPAILAAEAKKQGALLLHFSTEYVFDGKGERPWLETDVAAPLNVYGMSKLEGEQLIAKSGCQNLIFRTSWVYASRGKNFIKTMVKLLQERDELSVVSDQVGAPTGAALLADIASHAIRATLIDSKLGGLYHVAAAGETSWYEYACYIASQIKTANPNAKIAQIKSILSSSYPQRAQRPINSRMNTEKFRTSFNLNLPQWRQGVDHSLKELLGQA
jgi:dTDP-4-dehydrorhamnose reductase